MTYEDWLAQYRPIKNDIVPNAAYDGLMFETFGPELKTVQDVNAADPSTVWTLLEEDGTSWIASGYHFVNRMGYFITEEPCGAEHIEIVLHEDEPRYTIYDNLGGSYQVLDSHHGLEIALVNDYGNLNDAQTRAQAIADALNEVGYDYCPRTHVD